MHASQVSHQDDRYAKHQTPGLACLDDFGLMLQEDLQNRHPGRCKPEGGDFRDPALNIKPIHQIRHLFHVGRCGLGRGLASLFALNLLHHDRGLSLSGLGLDDEVTQHSVVVTERMLEFVKRRLTTLNI